MALRVLQIKIIKRYRAIGGNYRKIIILGDTPDTRNLEKMVSKDSDLGYRLTHFITKEMFNFEELRLYCLKYSTEEIFLAANQFTEKEITDITEFSDNSLIKVRLVPDFSGVYSSNLKIDYIGYQPILIPSEIPLDYLLNSFSKRVFDILFSLSIIFFILSWLLPILAILIRLESKGPIFFKQARSGLNNTTFFCYKFRSMRINHDAEVKQATKNDVRITKIGSFIRKTSIDELPQFFNVFMGNMSVVGPRPHMINHTREFSQIVDRYMVRHFVKPGITGLAQMMGYRGETKEDWDIKARVKMDKFYIENWNFFLDLKIIYYTVINVFKGEDQAY